MRALVVSTRFAMIALLTQALAACAMNPFDGEPDGPRGSPYDGDGYGDYQGRGAPRGGVADDDAPPRRVTRPVDDYGTGDIESQPLPPPGEVSSRPLDEPVRETERPPPPTPRGGRTLSTTEKPPSADDLPPEPVDEAPAPTYRSHVVKSGEEVADIADRYGVREVDIITLNGLKPPYRLKAGQELLIPADERAAAPSDRVVAGDPVTPRAKPPLDEKRETAEAAPADGAPTFDWPVSGRIIAGFGPSDEGLYNEGINIAVPEGTPVRASASGTVRYAGNELKGYGNLVLIEHAGGFVTAYAHNQTLTVKRGQKIERGAVLARSGQTGNVTSPQLHFEIRKGTQSVDPRKYLVAMN